MRLRVLAILLLVVAGAQAGLVTVWQIGIDGDPYASGYNATGEFSQENFVNDLRPGQVTRLPGDPLYAGTNNPTADDDFYLAGTYPAGFNGLLSTLTVPNNEPDSAFERALTDGDRTNRIHFFLSAAQAGAQSRLRLSFDLVWGGVWLGEPFNTNGEGFGPHTIEVRFKGGGTNFLLATRTVDRDTRLTLDFNATNVAALAGANTIEIVRTGPFAANIYYWVQFDFVKLEAFTNALADADSDGLARWWEEDNRLSDSNTGDAASDADGDGRTALQEYNGGVNSTDPSKADTDGDGLSDGVEFALGTNPLVADTDGDGLTDGQEVNGSPTSNPLLVDTDSDGVSDALERRLGSNPNSGASVPTVFKGGIGIHFVSQSDPSGVLGTNEITGVIPQTRWNDTIALRTWNRPAGGKVDIATPLAGQIVRSDGVIVSNLTLNWIAEDNDSSRNHGSTDARLMDGFIRAYTNNATLTFSNIPFASYDLYVHVGGSYDGQKGRLRLNNSGATDRFFRTDTTSPRSNFVEIVAGTTNFQWGNFIRYTNVTGSNATLTLTNLDGWSVGIHAVQIVDATLDFDGSGLPDWWEMKHALQPGSPALAAVDGDGDGLSNLQEFQRGTDPRKADTDGDGLSDGAEVAALTNPLHADTDGDGISDYDELNAPFPTNPLLADTDGDGVNDRDELWLGRNPAFNESSVTNFAGWVPFYRAASNSWEWKLENVQLVWDHGAGALAPNIWDEDQLVSFAVKNSASYDWRTFGMELRHYNGALTHLFHSELGGGFSEAGQAAWGIWESDYGDPPADLKSALGFSGYGPADISDRLRFHLFARRTVSSNSWTVTFEIRNQTSNTVVVTRSYTNCAAAPTVHDGSATWTDYDGNTNVASMIVHQGVRMFFSTNPLANLTNFAAFKDSDKDGMPDVWEDANGLNKFSAADATGNPDNDGLVNRDEFLAGTNPNNPDTDGDGVPDGVERSNSSNPNSATGKPEFTGVTWPSGDDLDGNGLPDAWEIRYRAFGLPPNGDADGDGFSNATEARWGTDPFDRSSFIAVSLARQTNDALVAWTQQLLKSQSLFTSPNLTSWVANASVPLADGGQLSVRLTNRFLSAPKDFYRVATDDTDTDGDGVPDWAESVIGSDWLRSNSLHAAMPKLASNGVTNGMVSGDYAAFVQMMKGGPPGSTSAVTRAQAARFLQQSTFGPTPAELDRVQQMGFAAWIDDQLTNQPATLHRRYIEQIYADFNGPRTDLTYSFNEMDQFINGNNATTPFARAAIAGPDQLRQRVAFALSQICVASRRDPNIENKPLAVMDFYDLFVRNAFGNYRDVLREVTLHPVMGRYLSHIGNQKARPEINQYPDENYAREVQQLFSIGLWELNPDGARQTNGLGQHIPTYGNAQITEFARVFTGLWFGGQNWGEGGWTDDDSSVPMRMWAEKHDFGEKTLLKGFVIPARAATVENALRDVDDALQNLFEHPNTGPFIGRQLIQFLITSNPSSNYVARVAATFANNGAGKRGDLAAVVKAILLDEEARDARWSQGAAQFGRLKEPVQRAMSLARIGGLERHTNLLWWTWGDFYSAALQEPTYSPSVFNFFRPSYQPPGLLTTNGLVGPAFQITDSYSSISFPNKLWEMTEAGLRQWGAYQFPPDYAGLVTVAGDAAALVDQANLLFCGGLMSVGTRDAILNAVQGVPAYDRLLRTRLAVYLAATCPEGAVQR